MQSDVSRHRNSSEAALGSELFPFGAFGCAGGLVVFFGGRRSGGRRRLVAMLEKSEIRFLRLGARRVAYELRGDGPPLVAPAWWVSHLELDW